MKEKEYDDSFEKDSVNYNNARPGYPKELYEDIMKFSNILKEDRILEIGAGSGIATIELAKFSSNIVVLEPGEGLINIAKSNLSEYKNIEYICDIFENCDFKEKSFDKIISATAFHWLDKETKFMNSHRYLKDNGYLILFWNSFCVKDNDLTKEINKLHSEYVYNTNYVEDETNTNVNVKVLEKIIKREKEMLDNDYFYILHLQRYMIDYIYNSQSYIELLNTFPDVVKLDSKVKEKFFDKIEKSIIRNGGKIKIPVQTSLYILKKKEDF